MFNMIHGNFHIWQGEQGRVFVSDESVKALNTYPSIDDAVNALFLMDTATMRQLARELNKKYEQHAKKGA